MVKSSMLTFKCTIHNTATLCG